MKVNELIVNTTATVGKKLILTAIAPVFKYTNGSRSDQLEGYRYSVVCADRAYRPLDVKIPGENMLPDFNAASGCPQVEFSDLNLLVYWTRDGYAVGSTASGVRIAARS